MSPIFSVITVSFNDKKGLDATLASVASQRTKGEIEHLVVDGGSPYDVEALVRHGNSNALLISESDDGIYDGMNKGIDMASGEFVIFMNSGDTFADNSVLEKVENIITVAAPDFIFGDANERLTNGEMILKSAKDIRRVPFGMITHHQAMFYNRSKLILNNIRYNLSYPLAGDYDFTARFLRFSETNKKLDFSVCIFEQGGTSYQNWHTARNEQFRVRNSLYGSFVFSSAVYFLQFCLGYVRRLLPKFHSFVRGRY